MNTIEVTSLTKMYGPVTGVDDVTFGVTEGEVFGFLGPNGAGKTTTIRCLMGLLRPTSGELQVLGERVRPGRATAHDRIGYLPGEFRVWPELTARRCLTMLAALGATHDATVRREELAERLGLDLDRKAGDLSKGNRQKIGVLFAFQHSPDLLILDEPTSGLDPLMRNAVLDLIRESAEAGATVFLSSHDLSEVSAVCSRAGILREGRLVELASVAEIVQHRERRLEAWFAKGAVLPTVSQDELPGVRVIEQGENMLCLAYRDSADPVVKWISQFPVDKISTPQTSLEEAFVQYYRSDEEERGASEKEGSIDDAS